MNDSADQIRSFASATHNSKQHFQYFSIELGPKSQLATHASNLLDLSIFVHDAIDTIYELYADKFPTREPVPLILIGHSYGGQIAKLSALLDSSLTSDCRVQSIVTLGTPHEK